MIFFFKQKTAYEMRISDWSSDGCSSDLRPQIAARRGARHAFAGAEEAIPVGPAENAGDMDAAATDSHPPIISQVEPGLAATSGNIMRRGLFGDFLGRHPRSQFDQLERARMIVAHEHREIGDEHEIGRAHV